MAIINEYFKKYTDKITFIELKDNTEFNVEEHPIKNNIPLPVLIEELISEIKVGNLEEEIKITNIIEGIIYLMGIDKNFPYIDEYIEILNAYDDNIEEYIFYKGIRFIDKEDYDNGAICFRALDLLNPKNLNSIFNYALALESIGKKHMAIGKDEEGMEFINKATSELESLLDIDEDYGLAYYKLGYHYKFSEQNLKAKLMWNKFLKLDKDELRLEEIRKELDNIENSVLLESGITYLSINKFDDALSCFLKILPDFKDWWELNYLIGASYKGLNDHEMAIEYFEKSLENNQSEADVYNELGISHFYLGYIDKAVKVFSKGIDNIKDDYKLYFNRGLGYIQLDKLEDAYKDIIKAVELNPNDENMNIQKKSLDEIFKHH